MESDLRSLESCGVTRDGRRWIEKILSKLPFVEWDRWVHGGWIVEGRRRASLITVYGWIHRPGRGRHFVLLVLIPALKEVEYWATSSGRASQIINERLGFKPSDHSPCRKIKGDFDVNPPNENLYQSGEVV